MRLILASASPRRADLLRAAGFQFETNAADVDESAHAEESPADYVQRLASDKRAAVAAVRRAGLKACSTAGRSATAATTSAGQASGPAGMQGDAIIVGADTSVVI